MCIGPEGAPGPPRSRDAGLASAAPAAKLFRVRPSAAEALKAAIRRAVPLTIALVVLGVIAVNAVKQLQGPKYSASARVLLVSGDLATGLDDGNSDWTDPERAVDTALALSRSGEIYDRAARGLRLPPEESSELKGMTSVSGDKNRDILDFTTTASDERTAVRAANAVAASYVAWRADITGNAIRRAITSVERRLRTEPRTSRSVLREQLEGLRVRESLNSGGAYVVERADSASKVSPAPVKDSILGAAAGLVIALMLSAAREALNTRVRSEADVEDALGKPVLASIQTLPKRAGLVTVGRHEGRFGDMYALLAANVMQLHRRPGPAVIAVTSSIAGEGKTTTAANLAVAMALRGHRVVLMDFDLRKPSLGRLFHIPSDSPGVIQLVDGDADLDSAVWSIPLNGVRPSPRLEASAALSGNGTSASVGEHGEGSLRIIAAGGAERAARVARSPRVPQLLAQLTGGADVVILDTPPALATVEMAELSRNVDMVLVVVRHSQVTRRSVGALNRQADGWQADIVGAVLTDSPAEEDDYYYATY
jgi:polysaccharide biosynthesis transport protein